MSLAAKLLSAYGGGVDKLFVDDVFQAVTRTGTGADVTVTTGIDMTKGYMLWSKGRSGATDHAIYDSARGVTLDLASNTTAAQTTQATGLKSVSATGHTVGSLGKMNTSAATYVDFIFRRAPKFFDVVTYTGNGVAGRQIPHEMGIAPGMIITKRTDSIGDWVTYHRSSSGNYFTLNSTNAATADSGNCFGNDSVQVAPDGAAFTIGTFRNASGATYVAYLFAHDTSADGIIQCGSFTTDGSGNATVNLGWEPQYLMYKSSSSATRSWDIVDSMRGFTDSSINRLFANLSNAESVNAGKYVTPTATGFQINSLDASTTMVYLAIRRPNKPPTLGTQVYNAIARTGTGAAATVTGVGFAPDLVIGKPRSAVNPAAFYDRLRGATKSIESSNTNAEATYSDAVKSFDMSGISLGADLTEYSFNWASQPLINHFFKRAPGVFDQVCYTGNSNANVAMTVQHGLGAVPELIIVKGRSTAYPWTVYIASAGATKYSQLDTTRLITDTMWNNTGPTPTVFTVGNPGQVNGPGDTYVAYLFATKTGISKCGNYTGNGTSQTIDCGFTTGARFVMIKRTDAAGDWYIWDTVRGLVAGNDPHLSLNTTAAEVTSNDSLDPASVGFVVNQLAATNINVTSASYIYLSFA